MLDKPKRMGYIVSMKTIGYRYSAESRAVGDVLPASRHWIADKPTDETLPGTCAFDSLAAAEQYAQWSPGQIIEIEGECVDQGELTGEIIIADAVVTRIVRAAK